MTETQHAQQASYNLLECHTRLVIAMDRSSSISDLGDRMPTSEERAKNIAPDTSISEWETQVDSTANAIESDAVVKIIEEQGPIAVLAMSFNGSYQLLANWTVIASRADAQAFASQLRAHASANTWGGTAIDHTIRAAVDTLRQDRVAALCPYGRGVIDISTDGVPNNVIATSLERDKAEALGMTINTIIVTEPDSISTALVTAKTYIQTRDGFSVEANWGNYAEHIEDKLVQELLEFVEADADGITPPPPPFMGAVPARQAVRQ